MKRKRLILVVILAAALAAGVMAACGSDDDSDSSGDSADSSTEEASTSDLSVFFGWLTGTDDLAAVAIEMDPANADGVSAVRAYVCDGKGPPEGKAIWFSGEVDAVATAERGESADLDSPGGDDKLQLDYVSDRRIQGSFTDADGNKAQFVAYPSIDGAGIYQVTLDEDLHYTGTSTAGDELDAQADKKGVTEGTLTTAGGEEVEFTVNSLALATPANLSARGLPNDYSQFADVNQVPGEYVALIAPGGSHWLGRSGDVRGGRPGLNIIGLDKKC